MLFCFTLLPRGQVLCHKILDNQRTFRAIIVPFTGKFEHLYIRQTESQKFFEHSKALLSECSHVDASLHQGCVPTGPFQVEPLARWVVVFLLRS